MTFSSGRYISSIDRGQWSENSLLLWVKTSHHSGEENPGGKELTSATTVAARVMLRAVMGSCPFQTQ